MNLKDIILNSRSSASIMIMARQNANFHVRDLINHLMFPVNAFRPTTSHAADVRFGFAGAGNEAVCVLV